MTNRIPAALLALATILVSSCSADSPAPPTSLQPGDALSARAPALPGTYTLSFLDHNLQPVSTLTVGSQELILGAHVTDALGNPAQRGSVSFQYCSTKGLPPGDITRADEAPSADCASGIASWKLLTSVNVNASGDAYMDFGIVQVPRTIGFRFKYASQGSSVPAGTSAPADFTWTAP